jgi:hypothetical protein
VRVAFLDDRIVEGGRMLPGSNEILQKGNPMAMLRKYHSRSCPSEAARSCCNTLRASLGLSRWLRVLPIG